MNPITPIPPGPDNPAGSSQMPGPLPRWEQFPTERQRELILMLAAIVVKRLPAPLPAPREAQHE